MVEYDGEKREASRSDQISGSRSGRDGDGDDHGHTVYTKSGNGPTSSECALSSIMRYVQSAVRQLLDEQDSYIPFLHHYITISLIGHVI